LILSHKLINKNNMKFLERQHLEILSALEAEGTLSKAAGKLHLTQPALTHSIRRLEEQLGAKVWEIKGRRVVLGALGQRLLKAARQILPRFQKAEEDLLQIAQGKAGVLKIGVECHPCYQWLMEVISQYFTGYPSGDIEVVRQFQFAAMEALAHHQIDLLITPDPYPSKALVFEPIREYQLKAVLSRAHPLAKKAFLEAQDFARQTLLTYPVPQSRLDIFTQILYPQGVRPKAHRAVETHEMMLVLAAKEKGIAIMPDWLIPEGKSEIVSLGWGLRGWRRLSAWATEKAIKAGKISRISFP
jgi:LysR family transcriptional regulator for metE and metH